MPKTTLNETDNSNYADQQFIKIVYDGKISSATSGGAEKLDYTITFKSDNKDYQILSILNGQEVNAPVINPESATEGYVFDTWTLDEEDIEFPIIPTSDLILIAKFKEAPAPSEAFIDGNFTFVSMEGATLCVNTDYNLPEIDLDKSYSMLVMSEDKTQTYINIDNVSFAYDEEMTPQITSGTNGWAIIKEATDSSLFEVMFIKPNDDESIKFVLASPLIPEAGTYYIYMAKTSEQSYKPLNDTEDFAFIQVTNGALKIDSTTVKSCVVNNNDKYGWSSSDDVSILNKSTYREIGSLILNRNGQIVIDTTTLDFRIASTDFVFQPDTNYIINADHYGDDKSVTLYNGPINMKTYQNDVILYYGNEDYVDYLLENYYIDPSYVILNTTLNFTSVGSGTGYIATAEDINIADKLDINKDYRFEIEGLSLIESRYFEDPKVTDMSDDEDYQDAELEKITMLSVDYYGGGETLNAYGLIAFKPALTSQAAEVVGLPENTSMYITVNGNYDILFSEGEHRVIIEEA